MSRLTFLLVHGFSGRDQDLFPLADRLREVFGLNSVQVLQLPDHENGTTIVGFDQERLLTKISSSLERLRHSTDTLVVLGHSTGGNLVLAALEQAEVVPDLLVLAATPFRVDLEYLNRWQQHQQVRDDLSLTALSGLVRLINTVADQGSVPACPVLLLQGGEDRLVVPQEAQLWQEYLAGEVRLINLPASGHQLFSETGCGVTVEMLVKEVSAALNSAEANLQEFAQRLIDMEPEAAQYVTRNRKQLRHLAMSPSGRRLHGKAVELPEIVPWEPIFANIEITTFCNLRCRHCARSILRPTEEMMSSDLFEKLLDRLPSAYRVTLVGLGEPLLHPQLSKLISIAKASGRRVGMVTNAQLLTTQRSAEILDAGLDSIAFSLDTVDPGLLSELRTGSELAEIETNIRTFCDQAEKLSRPISRAVFSAVSAASFAGLEALIDRVGGLGVHVVMLSDLNFRYNQNDSLSTNINDEDEKLVRLAITKSFTQGLPVLGVRALEDFGLAHVYRDALLVPAQQLYRRSTQHRHCFSPWQTISVNVAGEVCACDCQPELKFGSLQQQSLASLWNGSDMRRQRRLMHTQPSPECLICPRF